MERDARLWRLERDWRDNWLERDWSWTEDWGDPGDWETEWGRELVGSARVKVSSDWQTAATGETRVTMDGGRTESKWGWAAEGQRLDGRHATHEREIWNCEGTWPWEDWGLTELWTEVKSLVVASREERREEEIFGGRHRKNKFNLNNFNLTLQNQNAWFKII